jgi:RimJ/RimL family protein N-acetyltransferase
MKPYTTKALPSDSSVPVIECETDRLVLRRLEFSDAPFIVGLLNQPSFLANIGDRGVRDEADAHRYLSEGPMALYDKYGFGLWHVSRREDGAGIGMCGLLRRDILPDADIGYAYLPEFWGKGYAFEAAEAVMRQAASRFHLPRVVAVVSQHNDPSIRVLEKLGMRCEGLFAMRADEPEVRLYGKSFSGG